jgi:hypothetical protein
VRVSCNFYGVFKGAHRSVFPYSLFTN